MIGENIRNLRKKNGMTMEVLAKAIGVTGGYISQLERNLVDPSLSTLRKIARVFCVPMSSFLDDEGRETVSVIRADSNRRLGAKGTSSYTYLSPIPGEESLKMEMLKVVISAGTWDSEDDVVHNAEECTTVLDGCVCVMADGKSHNLNTGDSIYIRSNVPHRYFNPGKTDAVLVSCVCPPV